MNITKKVLTIVAAIATVVAGIFVFSACGAPAASGTYFSGVTVSAVTDAYPGVTLETFGYQYLTVYEDGTYRMDSVSEWRMPIGGGEYGGSVSDTVTYGTYTEKTDGTETTYTLSVPTRIVAMTYTPAEPASIYNTLPSSYVDSEDSATYPSGMDRADTIASISYGQYIETVVTDTEYNKILETATTAWTVE